MTTDRSVIERFGLPAVVELDHARERLDGELGILERDGRIIAICAHNCELAELPDLSSLEHLERLDVGANRLVDLPALPPRLRELYVYDNALVRLPELPPSLRVLDANRNRLVSVPPLAHLEFVYLASNRLTVPPWIARVRYLNISSNPLAELPIDRDLQELRCEDARLTSLPDAIAGLAGLRELHLRGNAIEFLPDTIDALSRLQVLDLRANRLDELPPSIATLPLTKLDVRWNPLRRRPSWLDTLPDCLVYT